VCKADRLGDCPVSPDPAYLRSFGSLHHRQPELIKDSRYGDQLDDLTPLTVSLRDSQPLFPAFSECEVNSGIGALPLVSYMGIFGPSKCHKYVLAAAGRGVLLVGRNFGTTYWLWRCIETRWGLIRCRMSALTI